MAVGSKLRMSGGSQQDHPRTKYLVISDLTAAQLGDEITPLEYMQTFELPKVMRLYLNLT